MCAKLFPMITNVEVTRNSNENALGVLRKFTRKVQSSCVISRMRSIRYSDRTQSHYKVKQKALKQLKRREEINELIKLGKAPLKK